MKNNENIKDNIKDVINYLTEKLAILGELDNDLWYKSIKDLNLYRNGNFTLNVIKGLKRFIDFIESSTIRSYRNWGRINEWQGGLDALSIWFTPFVRFTGLEHQASSRIETVKGDVEIVTEPLTFTTLIKGENGNVIRVENAFLVSGSLEEKIKVLEIDDSLASILENVKSWISVTKSYMAKLNVVNSIANYNINILYESRIRLKPIEADLFDLRKLSAVIESMSHVFNLFSNVSHSIDIDRFSYREVSDTVVDYVNRYLGDNPKISVLNINIGVLAGDLEIVIPKESMSSLRVHCPYGVRLQLGGDTVQCGERMYSLFKPAKPWTKYNNEWNITNLYINSSIDKLSLNILYE